MAKALLLRWGKGQGDLHRVQTFFFATLLGHYWTKGGFSVTIPTYPTQCNGISLFDRGKRKLKSTVPNFDTVDAYLNP